MLSLRKINKYYQVGAHALHVLRDVDFDVALAISGLLVLISATTLLLVKIVTRWRSTSTSPIPFAVTTQPSR